jgi:hypothetical protein
MTSHFNILPSYLGLQFDFSPSVCVCTIVPHMHQALTFPPSYSKNTNFRGLHSMVLLTHFFHSSFLPFFFPLCQVHEHSRQFVRKQTQRALSAWSERSTFHVKQEEK